MHIATRIAVGLLFLPLAEIVVFVLVVAWLGFLTTLLLVVLTSLAGALILRQAGGRGIARARTAVAGGTVFTTRLDSEGIFTVLGGALLLVPGFITDALGILVLLPAARRTAWRLLARALDGGTAQPGRPGTIDLDPDEWHRHPDRSLPRDRPPRP